MKQRVSNHPVSTEALNRAAEVYHKNPRLGIHNLGTSNNGLDHCQAIYRQEGGFSSPLRVRCTVVANNQTNFSKWFWLPVKEVAA